MASKWSGMKLRNLRIKLGLKQVDIAVNLNVTYQYISEVERSVKVTDYTAKRILGVLSRKRDRLIFELEDQIRLLEDLI